jgi:regulation of enolase protein 1 (concanavalin A-like superfamily)
MLPRPLARLVFIALLLAAASSNALAAEITVNIDVPGNRWKTVRLKNLPQGTSVSLQIRASGKIRVIVVDSTELKRFPKTRALFEASVDQRLGISVVIPRTGDYYVVFDNRKSTEPQQVTLRVKAEPPANRRPTPRPEETQDQT